MQSERYRGYVLWGHAIAHQEDLLQAERFAASGTITRETKFTEASGVLGVFDSEDDAVAAGLAWARAWVDSHG
ncbi:hypothetical protein [Paraburkholderia phenoliruptrix]|uniref:hypothetical protein n=1 Tax=Paraburkholderia phenoliruptrix TaxID=252970 RepID=UPI0009E50DBE|nr:hypothetical protein [Paraburkholderia phenoliruptrix]